MMDAKKEENPETPWWKKRIGGRKTKIFACLAIPLSLLLMFLFVDLEIYFSEYRDQSFIHWAGVLLDELEMRLRMWEEIYAPYYLSHAEDEDRIWLTRKGADFRVDVYWPRFGGPYPVVVLFHGGGWRIGDKDDLSALARFIANHGYVAFNFNYGLAPAYRVPQQIADAAKAVVWAKKRAKEFNGDPDRIAVAGYSAGAHLAAMVSLAGEDFRNDGMCKHPYNEDTEILCEEVIQYQPFPEEKSESKEKEYDSSVKAAVLLSGVYDLSPSKKDPPEVMAELFGDSVEGRYPRLDESSPVNYVSEKITPELVVFGKYDFLKKWNQEWVEKLKAAGADVSYYQAELDHFNLVHYFFVDGGKIYFAQINTRRAMLETWNHIVNYLDRKLKNAPLPPGKEAKAASFPEPDFSPSPRRRMLAPETPE